MSRLRSACAVAVLILQGVSLPALAGDDVNYSAPYMTVEDGELVTKYPAKEHAGDAPATAIEAPAVAESAPPAARPARLWILVAVLIAAGVAVLLRVKRRRQRANPVG